MHAVVGMWSMDPQKRERQAQELSERIVPSVRASRGFVRGTWAREIDGDRSASFVLFEDESAARDFMDAVRANAPQRSVAGVTNDEFLLVELVAEASNAAQSGHLGSDAGAS